MTRNVLGTPSTDPFASSRQGYGTTQNASSELPCPSQEITPTKRQRGVQYLFSCPEHPTAAFDPMAGALSLHMTSLSLDRDLLLIQRVMLVIVCIAPFTQADWSGLMMIGVPTLLVCTVPVRLLIERAWFGRAALLVVFTSGAMEKLLVCRDARDAEAHAAFMNRAFGWSLETRDVAPYRG
jgi:hypothetical protein